MRNVFFALFFMSQIANSALLPPVSTSVEDQDKIYAKYCVGDRKSSQRPKVNYKNSEVIEAAKNLQMVSKYSWYFYGGPKKAYGLSGSFELPSDFPDNPKKVSEGQQNAHSYLLQVCGEFRDRPTMIEEKINWARNMRYLYAEAQKPIDVKKEIWSQVSANSYLPYLNFTVQLWAMKRFDLYLNKNRYIQIPEGERNDYPVEGTTVCETKYIFKNYLEKYNQNQGMFFGNVYEGMETQTDSGSKKIFDEAMQKWKDYQSGYEGFKANCGKDELDYYYDFRGDSNLKHYSPESNGMIWMASSITGQCEYQEDSGTYETSDKLEKVTGDDDFCNKYFKEPFKYRWLGARAGLATWLFRHKSLDSLFNNQQTKVLMLPHFKMEKPFAFVIDSLEGAQTDFPGIQYEADDLGFNKSILGTNTNFAYERLRDAVNRHTNWYQSAYDDGMGLRREQAYSPFVASSYVMQSSDGFTAPGSTVQAPSDGCKNWMFVFRVHKDNWYTPEKLLKGVPVDFNKHWFDETSFGTDSLADTEKAWDRLGTALEGEFDSILYLHNISVGGQVNANCGKDAN